MPVSHLPMFHLIQHKEVEKMVNPNKKLLVGLNPRKITLTQLGNPTLNELVDYTKRGYRLVTGNPVKDSVLTTLLRTF